MMPSRAVLLREMLRQPGLIRALAVHDVFTACVAERAQVPLLFLGGFGAAASSLGVPDLGLMTATEIVDLARRMAARIGTPLIVDADTGFGGPLNITRTVQELEAAGAAGVLLEDQTFPKRCGHFSGKSVVPVDEMLERLDTALQARRNPDFVVIARTDARAVEGLDRAISRATVYAEAGADVCFVEAPQSVDELRRIPSAVPAPQLANMLVGGRTPIVPASELAEMGYKIAVDPIGSLQIAGAALDRWARSWMQTGRADELAPAMMSFDEIKTVLRLDEFLAGQPESDSPVPDAPDGKAAES